MPTQVIERWGFFIIIIIIYFIFLHFNSKWPSKVQKFQILVNALQCNPLESNL